jgi:hypothetical protein
MNVRRIKRYNSLNLQLDAELPEGVTYERIGALPALLQTALAESLSASGSHLFEVMEEVRRSEFFAAYLYGYPSRLFDTHPRTAATICKVLLCSALGDAAAAAIKKARGHPERPETALGLQTGEVDGADFFTDWGPRHRLHERGTRHLREYVQTRYGSIR